MKLTPELKKRISIVMIVLAAVMLLDVIYQVRMHVKWRQWMPDTLVAETAATQPATAQATGTQPAGTQPAAMQPDKKTKPKRPKKSSNKPPAVHAAIKKRDVFSKPKPTGHGLKLTGVLGTTALFTDRKKKPVAIEEGKSQKGVKVKSINGYAVTIEYKGKTETMKLFSGKASDWRAAGDSAKRPDRARPEASGRQGRRPAVRVGSGKTRVIVGKRHISRAPQTQRAEP